MATGFNSARIDHPIHGTLWPLSAPLRCRHKRRPRPFHRSKANRSCVRQSSRQLLGTGGAPHDVVTVTKMPPSHRRQTAFRNDPQVAATTTTTLYTGAAAAPVANDDHQPLTDKENRPLTFSLRCPTLVLDGWHEPSVVTRTKAQIRPEMGQWKGVDEGHEPTSSHRTNVLNSPPISLSLSLDVAVVALPLFTAVTKLFQTSEYHHPHHHHHRVFPGGYDCYHGNSIIGASVTPLRTTRAGRLSWNPWAESDVSLQPLYPSDTSEEKIHFKAMAVFSPLKTHHPHFFLPWHPVSKIHSTLNTSTAHAAGF